MFARSVSLWAGQLTEQQTAFTHWQTVNIILKMFFYNLFKIILTCKEMPRLFFTTHKGKTKNREDKKWQRYVTRPFQAGTNVANVAKTMSFPDSACISMCKTTLCTQAL